MSDLCPACNEPFIGHWQCAVCHCYGHSNVRSRRDWAICKDCDKALERRGVRRCTACGVAYPLAQVVASYPRQCPPCRTAKRKAKYQANVDYERASAKARRDVDNERERRRRRYQTDPEYRERKKAYHRAYYWRHRDKWRELRKARDPVRMNEMRRRWRATHREQEAARRRLERIRYKLAILRGER